MPKIKNDEIIDSETGGLIAAGESNITDTHWNKLHKGKEKKFLNKIKVSKDKRNKIKGKDNARYTNPFR